MQASLVADGGIDAARLRALAPRFTQQVLWATPHSGVPPPHSGVPHPPLTHHPLQVLWVTPPPLTSPGLDAGGGGGLLPFDLPPVFGFSDAEQHGRSAIFARPWLATAAS